MNFKFPLLILISFLAIGVNSNASAQIEDPSLKPIGEVVNKLVTSFNEAKPDAIAAMFVQGGELIDEDGDLHQGSAEIGELLKGFFEKFPGAKMEIQSESMRMVGPVAFDDGTRIISVANGSVSTIRYSAVLVNTPDGWKIASLRDFPDETPATSGEKLQPLAWLIGDWINEGSDGRVKINYRWSEDGNFILGEFEFNREGSTAGKSSQRIAWDSLQGAPRSWLFDSDGGFTEATWHQLEDSWMIRSAAVLPDGLTGSATLKLMPQSESRFVLAGSNRLIGGVLEDDYEITIVKAPMSQSKDAGK
jgi:ketosteroid isomerase-like protein